MTTLKFKFENEEIVPTTPIEAGQEVTIQWDVFAPAVENKDDTYPSEGLSPSNYMAYMAKMHKLWLVCLNQVVEKAAVVWVDSTTVRETTTGMNSALISRNHSTKIKRFVLRKNRVTWVRAI